MTPSACSLYDKIKLYKLRNGIAPAVVDLRQGPMDAKDLFDCINISECARELIELTNNGYIKFGPFNTIRMLK